MKHPLKVSSQFKCCSQNSCLAPLLAVLFVLTQDTFNSGVIMLFSQVFIFAEEIAMLIWSSRNP